MNKEQQRRFLSQKYEKEQLTWQQIADETGMSKSHIFATAKKLGIKSRSHADSQKLALATGRSVHPTKDKKVSEETKRKMSDSIALSHKNRPQHVKERLRQLHRENFSKRSEAEKEAFWHKAAQKVHEASIKGSKTEKYVLGKLFEANYKPKFHVSQLIGREQMEIDILVPELALAIEIDGPFHYSDIFNDGKVDKIQERDKIKNGLLLSKGLNVIRIKIATLRTQRQKNELWAKLEKTIHDIKTTNEPSVYTLEIN